eukprot:907447-Pyramimonas_sp.AAC.1
MQAMHSVGPRSRLSRASSAILQRPEACCGERRLRRAAVCFRGPDGVMFAQPRAVAFQGDLLAVHESFARSGAAPLRGAL